MKTKLRWTALTAAVLAIVPVMFGLPSPAQGQYQASEGKYYTKKADSFIFMVDTSGSMQEAYRDTGRSRVEVMKDALRRANQDLPDLAYRAGFYAYTPWEAYLAPDVYDDETLAEAIDRVPRGYAPQRLTHPPSPLGEGLRQLGPVLEGLDGRTVVYLFTDGQNTSAVDAVAMARELDRRHDVCFIVVSAAPEDNPELRERVAAIAGINDCSKQLTFERFIARPEICTGEVCAVAEAPRPEEPEELVVNVPTDVPLDTDGDGVIDERDLCAGTPPGYAVDANGCRVPTAASLDNVHFAFDRARIRPRYVDEVNDAGIFLWRHPEAQMTITGHTDAVGPKDYNRRLARRRAEAVRDYLLENFDLMADRIAIESYGENRPIGDNDTAEGRRQNRRAGFVVTGAYERD